MDSDEVVDSTKCRRDVCLDAHSVLWEVYEDDKALFENSKYMFNDIVYTGIPKIEKFFFLNWSSLK
jgi:hypothetical protein